MGTQDVLSARARIAGVILALAAGLCFAWLWAGVSPILLPDTNNDYQIVRHCQSGVWCGMTGVGSTFAGINQSAPWHAVLLFLDEVGVGPEGVHLALAAAGALVFPVVFLVGVRVGGAWTGVLSLILLTPLLSQVTLNHHQVYNTRLLPLMGSLFLFLMVEAAHRRRQVLLFAAAALAAVMTDYYLSNAVLVLGVAAVGVLAFPDRRARVVAWTLTVFGVVLLANAPGMWWENLQQFPRLWQQNFEAHQVPFGQLLQTTWPWQAAAGSLLVLSAVFGRAHGRTTALVLSAVLLPTLTAFTLVQAAGGVLRSDEYLLGVLSTSAVGLAWVTGRVVRGLRLHRVVRWGLLGVVLLMVCPQGIHRGHREIHGVRLLSLADVRALRDLLQDEYGWGLYRAYRAVRSPWSPMLLRALFHTIPMRHQGLHTSRPLILNLVKAKTDELPIPLPPNWDVVRVSENGALVAIRSRPWLDWAAFRVCIEGEELQGLAPGCRLATLLPYDHRMTDWRSAPIPGPNSLQRYRLTLRVPVRFPPVTDEKVLLMPTIESRCAGRFAHLPPGAEVSEDRRLAVLHAPGSQRPDWVDLVYEVGSDECPDGALEVMPPFLVEVDPEDLEAYADLLAEASADVLPVPEDEIEEDWP